MKNENPNPISSNPNPADQRMDQLERRLNDMQVEQSQERFYNDMDTEINLMNGQSQVPGY